MKSPLLAFVASIALCSASSAQNVTAGQDSLRPALAQIIPEPFKVNIDSRIPSGTVLQWDDASDWMTALKQAAARGNLVVRPRWDLGQIDVVPGPQPKPAPTATVQSPSAGAGSVVATAADLPKAQQAPATAPVVVTATPAATTSPPAPVSPAPKAQEAEVVVKTSIPAPVPHARAPATSPGDSGPAEQLPAQKTAAVTADLVKVTPIGRTWNVETKDVTLAATFQRWASAAGWRVRWDAAKHVMVEAPDSFTGSFEDAVESQLGSPGIAFSTYPLEVCFYPNNPPLARITRKGDQLKECQ